MDEQKNMLMAAVLSFVVIATWFFLFPPAPPPQVDPQQASVSGAPTDGGAAISPSGPVSVDAQPRETREDALARAPRIAVDSPRVAGTISLKGGRLDDLRLLDYGETRDEDSERVTLLSPIGAQHPFYAIYGWLPTAETPVRTPGPNTSGRRWRAPSSPPTRP
jgi:YidC/Oxa1 family membrane protein insertase